jgi:uncharacterized protein
MKNKKLIFIIIPLAIVLVGALAWYLNRPNEGEFNKEGSVSFIDQNNQQTIVRIDVELANTPSLRAQGLMNRPTIGQKQGMLFVFPDMDYRSFWMKNTNISLDIIYADDKGKIVSIKENTVPFSEASVPSDKPAMYVVEVNAGFCARHQIQAGDRITFAPVNK